MISAYSEKIIIYLLGKTIVKTHIVCKDSNVSNTKFSDEYDEKKIFSLKKVLSNMHCNT